MVKISVIIPVYNVEAYLEEALNSLVNQTMFEDIEVIMVDDDSTDNSRFIIDEYAKKYSNFHAYHKKHEGQGIARNYGLEFAKGEYVHFLDADDYIPPKAYEILYNFNPSNDFIIGNLLRFGEYNIWESVLFKEAFKYFDADCKSFCLNDMPAILWDTITCNKLFKKEFLDQNNIRFINKDTFYEDILFSLEAYIHANSIGFSQNIFYYWRFRYNRSSITQKIDDVKNFQHRLDILKIYNGIMNDYSLSEEIKNIVYDKWLRHDLKTSLKKINNYPGKYYLTLIEDTIKILNLMPRYLRYDLNVYLKILYTIVENRDINSLLLFAHLEDNIKENPRAFPNIGQRYLDMVDFNCDGENQEFTARVSDAFNDESNLYLEFVENLEFISNDCPHEMLAFLIYKNKEVPLILHNNQIVIPLNLVKDINHLKIKMIYRSNSFEKVVLLKNYNRKSISYANHDIDLGIGINNILYLDVKKKTDNDILINNIVIKNGEFVFICESKNKINYLTLTNYVTYNENNYPVLYAKGSNKFIFAIPYDDLNKSVIKKFELNCPQSFNSINLAKKINLKYKNSKVIFRNKRNKIYISVKFNNAKHDDVKKLIKKNKKLKKQNNKLNKKVDKLNKKIDTFKERKAVKLIDNTKNIFKR